MQTDRQTESMDTIDFPVGSLKPVTYLCKEIPRSCSQPKKASTKVLKLPTSVENITDILTSLPVSTALLALVISQGATLNNSLWYLNYLALAVILLICTAVVISYLSVPASHQFCESVFFTIYTPASQLFKITINVRTVYSAEHVGQTCKTSISWMKQALLLASVLAATHGFTLLSAAYLLTMTSFYSLLANQLAVCCKSIDDGRNQFQPQASLSSLIYVGLLSTVVVADISVFGCVAAFNLLYFVLVDDSLKKLIHSLVESGNFEVMEGLDRFFTDGLVCLLEVAIVLAALFIHPYLCLIYLPLLYFDIYLPLTQFRMIVTRINSESLCLSHFEVATKDELKQYDDICAICLGAMQHARITPCKHIFHGKCLKDCLQKKAQCPMCNANIL